jgi:hypothetical protein
LIAFKNKIFFFPGSPQHDFHTNIRIIVYDFNIILKIQYNFEERLITAGTFLWPFQEGLRGRGSQRIQELSWSPRTYFKFSYLCFFFLLKSNFFFKINSRKINSKKINYFLIFSSIIENKLENIFQCLVMSRKMSWKITY